METSAAAQPVTSLVPWCETPDTPPTETQGFLCFRRMSFLVLLHVFPTVLSFMAQSKVGGCEQALGEATATS